MSMANPSPLAPRLLGLNWAAPVMPGDVKEVSCLHHNEGVVLTREYLAGSLTFTFVPWWAKIVHKGCIVWRKGDVLPCKTDVDYCHVSKKCCSLIARFFFIFFKSTPHRKFASDPEMLPKKSQLYKGSWVVSDWFHDQLICAPTCKTGALTGNLEGRMREVSCPQALNEILGALL